MVASALKQEQLAELQERLSTHNTEHATLAQGRRSYKGPLLLLLAFLALSLSTVLVGLYLRHAFEHATQEGRRGGRHINIRVTTLPGLQPYTHSSVAHAQAEKLKEMAHSPAQMQAYMRLSPAEKEAFLAEQISERLAVDKFLESSLCRGLRQIYQPIVDDMLNPFKAGVTVESLQRAKQPPSATLFIKHGQMYVEGSKAEREHPMVVLWAEYLYWLLQQVKLPDLVVPLNPDDLPRGRREPWFSFCRQPRTFNDLLLPNLVEDGLFPVNATARPSRAGRDDTRRPMAIWLGRPMSWQRGKRRAIVEAGRLQPEKVYAGLTDWEGVPLPRDVTEEQLMQYYLPRMPLDDWAEHFKYVINVEGNCGSARLAKQLHSDAAVLFVAGEDEEWYYSLLKPFVHFIPVTVAADGSTDLLEQIAWAEAHSDEVRGIVEASTTFAQRHLAPGSGRDCYSALLLQGFAGLIRNSSEIRPPEELPRYVSLSPPQNMRDRG